jgi:hypothetical protein
MSMTHEDIVPALQYILDEMSVIESNLNAIDMSIPGAEIELLNLESEFGLLIESLPELIEFCAKQKPDPQIIGNKLKHSFDGTGRLLGICTELRTKYTALTGKTLPCKAY